MPVTVTPSADSVIDRDGILLAWMDRHGAGTLALRPDGFVYAAAPAGRQLPPPPLGFTATTTTTALATNP